jgi:hypothetical protein
MRKLEHLKVGQSVITRHHDGYQPGVTGVLGGTKHTVIAYGPGEEPAEIVAIKGEDITIKLVDGRTLTTRAWHRLDPIVDWKHAIKLYSEAGGSRKLEEYCHSIGIEGEEEIRLIEDRIADWASDIEPS